MELKPATHLASGSATAGSDSARPLGRQAPPSASRPGAVKPLSAQRFSVSFTADGEFRELLDEVRALLSHSEPKGDLLTVMKQGLEVLRGELLKKRFGVGRKPRRTRLSESERGAVARASESASGKRSRHVPAAVAREVYVRDGGRCTFCSEEGRRCGERRLLQLDHVLPFADGGEAAVGNLRVRCRAHNLYTARFYFGAELTRATSKRQREPMRRSELDKRCSAAHAGDSLAVRRAAFVSRGEEGAA